MRTRQLRLIGAVAIILLVPVLVAGAASRDQDLANKGFKYIEKGQLAEAEKVLLEAVQINPNNAYAVLNLGTVYQRTGRFDLAREMFEKVIAMNATQNPPKRSKFLDESKNLKEIAEYNLTTLPKK